MSSTFLDVKEAYDRWSTTYDEYDNPMIFMANAALRATVPVASGLSVVEFGCGTGRNLAYLRVQGAVHVTGLDLAAGMLERAKALGVADDLQIYDMSADTDPEVQVCDLALFVLSLEHVADLAGPLRKAVRTLRAGGEIIIVEIHPFMSLGGAKAHFVDSGELIEMPTHPHQFSDYIDAFREAGLFVARCREWRPSDVDGPLPAKVLKRGKDMPIVVSFQLKPIAN